MQAMPLWKGGGLSNAYANSMDSGHPEKMINRLPDDKILDWSKLKQIADDILKSI